MIESRRHFKRERRDARSAVRDALDEMAEEADEAYREVAAVMDWDVPEFRPARSVRSAGDLARPQA